MISVSESVVRLPESTIRNFFNKEIIIILKEGIGLKGLVLFAWKGVFSCIR